MKTKEEIELELSNIRPTEDYSLDAKDLGWIDALNWVLDNQ